MNMLPPARCAVSSCSIRAFTRAARLLQFESGEDDFVLNTLANLCLPLLCTERHEEALAVARDLDSKIENLLRESAA